MFLVSWRSLGTARTEMTGMAGVSSFRRASLITPAWVSHLAPTERQRDIEQTDQRLSKRSVTLKWLQFLSTFHVQSIHICPLPGRLDELLLKFLSHINCQVDFIQGPLVLPCQSLHHRCGQASDTTCEEWLVQWLRLSLGGALLLVHGCVCLPVRKDWGLKSPESHTTLGRDRSWVQLSSSLHRCNTSLYLTQEERLTTSQKRCKNYKWIHLHVMSNRIVPKLVNIGNTTSWSYKAKC